MVSAHSARAPTGCCVHRGPRALLVPLAACWLVGACGADGATDTITAPRHDAAVASAHCGPEVLPRPVSGVTTRGDTALGNLSAQIDGYAQALAQRPGNPSYTGLVVDRLLTRAHFLGRPDDLRRARELTRAAIEAHPTDAGLHLLHARVATALHRFDTAAEAIAQAAAAGAAPAQITARRQTIALATGDLVLALGAAETAAEERGDLASLSAYAGALGAAGRFAEADEAYVGAAEAYRDVSPFPLAWIDFQRGVMWSERAGRPDLALPLYEAAVDRLPSYNVAVVHLSELLLVTGERPRAFELLRTAAGESGDPEPTAVLAAALAEEGASDEVAQLTTRAEEMYEAILADLPEAYAAHAAEFFLGAGDDPSRAFELARGGVETRVTAGSLALAIRAAAAAGASTEACSYTQQALAELAITPSLAGVVVDAVDACGAIAPDDWTSAAACIAPAAP